MFIVRRKVDKTEIFTFETIEGARLLIESLYEDFSKDYKGNEDFFSYEIYDSETEEIVE